MLAITSLSTKCSNRVQHEQEDQCGFNLSRLKHSISKDHIQSLEFKSYVNTYLHWERSPHSHYISQVYDSGWKILLEYKHVRMDFSISSTVDHQL